MMMSMAGKKGSMLAGGSWWKDGHSAGAANIVNGALRQHFSIEAAGPAF
jgi:hypothetical protein